MRRFAAAAPPRWPFQRVTRPGAREPPVNHLYAGQPQGGFEVGRERRRDLDRLAAHGMRKGELRRMEELPVEAELRAMAVDPVADDRVADRRHVDADLVRPAGLEGHVKERPSGERLDELEVRDGVAGTLAIERLAGRVAPVAADRGLDPPGPRRRPPAHERDVGAPHPPPPKLGLEAAERLLVARHDQEPRRVAVEPVDDAARPGGPPPALPMSAAASVGPE